MNEHFANGRRFAIIAGMQERFGAYNSASNIAATLRLQRYLKDSRIDFQEVQGWYKGVEQGPSFLIWDISEESACFIAEMYGQESIVTERGLVFNAPRKLVPAIRCLFGDEAKATGNYTQHADGFCWAFILEGMSSDDSGGQIGPVAGAPAPATCGVVLPNQKTGSVVLTASDLRLMLKHLERSKDTALVLRGQLVNRGGSDDYALRGTWFFDSLNMKEINISR